MPCMIVIIALGASTLPVAWSLRSMYVSEARLGWWLIWPCLIILGIAGGYIWADLHPVPLTQEDRPFIVAFERFLFCYLCTTALLWIYSAIMLFRFGFWPRSPESLRSFPVIQPPPTQSTQF
jgi:hypothetical protein